MENNTYHTGLTNTYGEVKIIEKNGLYYWMLEDCFDSEPEQIPEYLFKALLKFITEKDGFVLSKTTS